MLVGRRLLLGNDRTVGYYIGIDEAGYGPNLGPLVISATVWRVPGAPQRVDLYELLRDAVTRDACDDDDPRVAVADSKSLYQSRQRLAALECSVHALLHLAECAPGCWDDLWQALAPDSASEVDGVPWHLDCDDRLPLEADGELIGRRTAQLREGCHAADVELLAIRSVAVFPARFNVLVEEAGNKGGALSRLTIELLDRVLEPLDGEPILAVCDKHGGRHYYGPLLQRQFPDPLIEVRSESPEQSIYRWGPAKRRVEVRFCCRAEAYLPVAAASMTAKYLREVAMRQFNRFWCQRLPELKPTAGYPGDSRRFKEAIAELQVALGIDDRLLWRSV